ncbi:MAG: prolyl oligopeptidase family serine peptidase [Ferruginibacter sp.]
MKKIIALLLLFATIKLSFAQDGKIIDQIPVAYTDSFRTRMLTYFPEWKTFADSISISRITYLSDGLKVKGYLAEPKKPGKYPCVIYNRGGNREFSKLDEFQYGLVFAEMASWGYVVVGSQYRGNDGGEGQEEFGGKDLDDVMNLIPLLGKVQNADTSRIGMHGFSRGGMMAYLALTKTDRIKAAVLKSAPADFIKSIATTKQGPDVDTMLSVWLPAYRADKEGFLKSRSALFFADKLCKTTPIFIIQGSADDKVTTDMTLEMVSKLYTLKHPLRFSLFEGGNHGLYRYWNEMMAQEKDFFDTYVRDKKQWPSLELH